MEEFAHVDLARYVQLTNSVDDLKKERDEIKDELRKVLIGIAKFCESTHTKLSIDEKGNVYSTNSASSGGLTYKGVLVGK